MSRANNICIIKLNGEIFQYFLSFNPIEQNSSNQINLIENRITFEQVLHSPDDDFIEFSNGKNDTFDYHTKNTSKRKIQFESNPTTHILHVWHFAYWNARKDIWQQAARNRARFENRINKLNEIITPILRKKQVVVHVQNRLFRVSQQIV